MLEWLLWLLGKVGGFLWKLTDKVFVSVIASKVKDKLPASVSKKIKDKLPANMRGLIEGPSLQTYLKGLESALKGMPFIYRDLKEDVLNDFVDVTSQPIDLSTLKDKKSYFGAEVGYGELELNERLKRSKKVLFLGDAGLGKTTFQRYIILNIINDRANVKCLEPKENVIPFFVPLKIVDNSKPYPILRHLLEKCSLLSPETGLRTLVQYARQQRLFLFLDGYDEIQFIGGKQGQNFVRDELSIMLMSGNYFTLDSNVPDELKPEDFYESLASCRIWLSSRKQFYDDERHRLTPPPPKGVKLLSKAVMPPETQPQLSTALKANRQVGEYKTPELFALELRGIGNNRVRLVRNIFSRYKEIEEYKNLFSEKYFIDQIDEAPDKEISVMSNNPLWLTVMCYTYARKVIDKQDYRIQAASNFYDLVSECINLLLYDLDEDKARHLPDADRAGLLNTRNDFFPEKKAFLDYFASQLFIAEETTKAVFDKDYIISRALEFFESHREFVDSERILNGLRGDVTNNPHFVDQLLFSGIFVIVDKQGDNTIYDFPHRRFREVLAAGHFHKYGYEPLILNLRKEGLSELLYVFFNRSSSQDEILGVLFDKLIEEPKSEYYTSLIKNCLKQSPPSYSPNRAIQKFLIKAIRADVPVALPVEISSCLKTDADFSDTLSDLFKESLGEEKLTSTMLCSYLLSRYDGSRLRELISTTLVPSLENRNRCAIQIVLGFGWIADYVEKRKNSQEFTDLLFYLKKVYPIIVQEYKGLPLAPKGQKPRSCYIVTDYVIKSVKNFALRMGMDVEEKIDEGLMRHKHKVYLAKEFLAEDELNFDRSIRGLTIRVARMDYSMYSTIMSNIWEFNKSTSKQMNFLSLPAEPGVIASK